MQTLTFHPKPPSISYLDKSQALKLINDLIKIGVQKAKTQLVQIISKCNILKASFQHQLNFSLTNLNE